MPHGFRLTSARAAFLVIGASPESAGLLGGKDDARAAAILRVLARQSDGLSLGQIANAGLHPIRCAAHRRRAGDGEFRNDGASATPTRPASRIRLLILRSTPKASGRSAPRCSIGSAGRSLFPFRPHHWALPVAEIIRPTNVARHATTDLVRSATIACNIARTALVDHASSEASPA